MRRDRRTLHRGCRGALVLAATLIASACAPRGADVARSGAALQHLFRQTARRHGVPEPVLLGIAYAQTQWFTPDGPSLLGGYGMMGLVEGGTLEEAARQTGLPRDALMHDPRANLAGGAAVLRAKADRYFAEYPDRDPTRLSDWFELTKLMSGVTDPEMAEAFGIEVFRAIHDGAERLFPDGTRLRLEARPGEVDLARDLIYASRTQYLTPDYSGAIWRPSPNYSSRNGTAITRVVIHTCQGGYSGCVSWLRNTAAQASAHYVVSKTGEISQLVENKNKAWHVRCHNPETIGIEHAGYVDDPQNYTTAMYQASANLVRFLCDTYGIPKTRDGIVGHGDPVLADCNTHTDPGPYWNWSYFLDLVGGGGGGGGGGTPATTGTVKGFVFWGKSQADFDRNLHDATKRVAGATVTFSPGGASATTDATGYYRIDLPEGTYQVHAEAPGYQAADRPEPVTVTAGATSWGSTMVLEAATTDTDPPRITVSSPEDGTHLRVASVEVAGSVSDASPIASLTVAGRSATLTQGAFRTSVPLTPGDNTIEVVAQDAYGNEGRASVRVVYDGPAPPVTGLTGVVFDAAHGQSAGVAGAEITLGDLALAVTTGEDGTYTLEAPAGTYPIVVTAAGYQATTDTVTLAEGEVARFDIPLTPEDAGSAALVITYPEDGALLSTRRVLVTGRFAKGVARIDVGGQRATLDPEGEGFSAEVKLGEGEQSIVAIAYDEGEQEVGRAEVQVRVEPAGCGCESGAPGHPLAVWIVLPLALLAAARQRRAGPR